MPIWLKIILIVFSSLLFVWLLIILMTLIILQIYKSKLNHMRMGLNIILAQKYDVAVVLAKFLLSNDIVLPEDIMLEFNLDEKPNFNYFNTFERKSIGKRINDIVDTLVLISHENNLDDNLRYITLKGSIDDIEKQQKHNILNYNNKVNGYNYWVKFIPFRLISKIFKIKLKNEIVEK